MDLPAPFDVGWVDFAVASPASADAKPQLSSDWRTEVEALRSSPDRWLLITAYGEIELEGRMSSIELTVSRTSVLVKLSDGWATGSFVEPIVVEALGPLVEHYRSVPDLSEVPLVLPDLRPPFSLGAMARLGVPRLVSGWRGDRPTLVWDRRDRDAVDISDDTIERAVEFYEHPQITPDDPEGVLLGLVPEVLHDVFWRDVDSYRWIVAVFAAGAGDLATLQPPPGFAVGRSEVIDGGGWVLLRADRRYGLLDRNVGDQLATWFTHEVGSVPDLVWASATPVSSQDARLGVALVQAVERGDPTPPLATWLMAASDATSVVRCGDGPYPTKSELDKAQNDLGPVNLDTIIDTRHPLDDMATPTRWLDAFVGDWGQLNPGARHREAAYIELTGKPRFGWSLKAIDPDATTVESLTLSAQDWNKLLKLTGPLSTSGFGTWVGNGHAQRFIDYPEPVQSFLERHAGRYVAIVPGERSHDDPAPSIHRRIGTPPNLGDADPATVCIVVNDADGKPIEGSSIALTALVDHLTKEAAAKLSQGDLTLGEAITLAEAATVENPDHHDTIQDWIAAVVERTNSNPTLRLGLDSVRS